MAGRLGLMVYFMMIIITILHGGRTNIMIMPLERPAELLEAEISSLDKSKSSTNDVLAQAREKQMYSRLPLFFRPFIYFMYRYFIKGGFLEGKRGLYLVFSARMVVSDACGCEIFLKSRKFVAMIGQD